MLQKSWRKVVLLILAGLAGWANTRIRCDEGSVMTINDQNQEECVSCGPNCMTCLLMAGQQPDCFYCKEGFYLQKGQTPGESVCKPCFSGCQRCLGPALSECSDVMPNFFYNTKSKKIEQCADGCQSCFSSTECSICAQGFYSKKPLEEEEKPKDEGEQPKGEGKEDKEDKKKLDVGKIFEEFSGKPKSIECVSCNIPDCRYCKEVPDKIKKTKYLSCGLCDKGFAIVDDKCAACPKKCEYCRPQTLECLHCTPGFQWNKKKRKCQKISIPNCSLMKKKECLACDNLFYLDPDSKGCVPCRTKFPNCEHCVNSSGTVRCRFCKRGFFVVGDEDEDEDDEDDEILKTKEDPKQKKKKKKKKPPGEPGTCAACPKNCSHCSQNTCYICAENFYFHEKKKKCLKCNIENCESCFNAKTCANCRPGFRFNSKSHKCEKCAGDCLRCSESGHCYECPVDHFVLLHEKIKKKSGQTILNNLLGMFLGSVGMNVPSMPVTTIEFRTECLKECPATLDGLPVIVNLAQRRCVVKTTDQTQQVPSVSLPNLSKTGSFYLEVQKLKLHYLEEISQVKKSSLRRKAAPGVQVSEECFNNGLIRKIYRGNLSSYYICRCLPGFMGDNCQITRELHETIQQKLLLLLDSIHQRLPTMSKHRYKEVLNTLIEFNKFKIDETVVSKVMEALGFFLDRNHSVDNKKLLYILYDSMMLSVFDLLEDIHKASNNQLLVNSDAEQEELLLRGNVKKLVMLIEASFEDLDYAHSFLDETSKEYVGLQTFSFIISEFRLGPTSFQSANPNIDSSFNTEDVSNLTLLPAKPGADLDPKFNVQLINFSIELFQSEFQDFDLLTNVLYLKFLDSLNPHIRVSNHALGVSGLRLSVPLLTLPGFVDIKDHIFCYAFKSGDYESSHVKGEVQGFDEDTRYADCLFSGEDAFSNTYFAVFIKKRDDKD